MIDNKKKIEKTKEVLSILEFQYKQLCEKVKTDIDLLPLKDHCAQVIRTQRQLLSDLQDTVTVEKPVDTKKPWKYQHDPHKVGLYKIS